MENILRHLSSAVFIAGAWNLLNGILHDVFVLRSEHGKQYDRNLLRLLMDGHILITSGIILMIVTTGIRSQQQFAYYAAAAALLSIVIYCFMIFPFLKSFITLLINSIALISVIISLIKK